MIYSHTNYNDDFIAGFWEGDGTMYFCNRINAPVIKVGSNNKNLILKIQERLGKGYIDENDKHSKLVYMCWKRTLPILNKFAKCYFSEDRLKRLLPLLERAKIKYTPKEMNKEWLKGFFSAEGYHGVSKNYMKSVDKIYYYERISFSQKNKFLINKICKYLENFKLSYNLYKRKNGVYSVTLQKDVPKFKRIFQVKNLKIWD